jgi:hypothetical protein
VTRLIVPGFAVDVVDVQTAHWCSWVMHHVPVFSQIPSSHVSPFQIGWRHSLVFYMDESPLDINSYNILNRFKLYRAYYWSGSWSRPTSGSGTCHRGSCKD